MIEIQKTKTLNTEFETWIDRGFYHRKPTTFATLTFNGKTKFVFALPGNPASAAVMTHLLVLPALKKMSGHQSPLPTQVTAVVTSLWNCSSLKTAKNYIFQSGEKLIVGRVGDVLIVRNSQMDFEAKLDPDRPEYRRAILAFDETGCPRARSTGKNPLTYCYQSHLWN